MPGQTVKIFKKYDEALIKANSTDYKLTIQVSLDGLSFCIFDSVSNKFLSLESISFNNMREEKIYTELQDQYINNVWLALKYHSISIIYEPTRSTLVPVPLFDNSEKELISKLNFEVNGSNEIQTERLTILDAINLYPIPSKLISLLSELYPDHRLHSHMGTFIESLLLLYKNLPVQKTTFVNIRDSQFDIAITEGRKLLYFNSFEYKTKDDFIYYLVFVLELLQLNPEETEVVLSGFIDRQSNLYELIYKYIRNVSLQKLTDIYKYSYVFNDIPSHYYFNLLNVHLCE